SGVSDSVPAGASVTLQCSVLSESRAAELQVLWFRAAPPQSHPQIIYTHHNSGHQCESGSPTHTCVYNFSKNILSHSDTGTYYCAVAVCGKIIFGNGTRVQLDSAQAANQPNSVITAGVGDNVTLHCFRLKQDNTDSIIWYKQQIGQKPHVIVQVRSEPIHEDGFNPPKFSIEKENKGCHLKIAKVEPSDEAMYYCGHVTFFTSFINGTFLSVKDKPDVKVSVSQSSVSDSVPAGASVTLQCSVLSESRAAELQVLWFRAAPPQSHPQIIYTHHNSGHQCESGSPTHTCVYNFSKNILSHNDTGTYYCAVVLCGKIIFGNGTRVQLVPGHAVDFNRPSFVSVKSGERVTLNCTFEDDNKKELMIWYKQQFGGLPQEVGNIRAHMGTQTSPELKSGHTVMEIMNGISLTILQTKK
ncbi:putative immune-type receptor 15a precursor, partial [Clarias magur]